MNITPGHFQSKGCCANYGYYTQQEVGEGRDSSRCAVIDCMPLSSTERIKIRVLYMLGLMDLYK